MVSKANQFQTSLDHFHRCRAYFLVRTKLESNFLVLVIVRLFERSRLVSFVLIHIESHNHFNDDCIFVS